MTHKMLKQLLTTKCTMLLLICWGTLEKINLKVEVKKIALSLGKDKLHEIADHLVSSRSFDVVS